jgi:uncharacterized membrane protein YgcG
MATNERRQFLKNLLGTLAGAAGTVVLAATEAKASEPPAEQSGDIQERADRLASAAGEEEEFLVSAFAKGGFRNGAGGGFRNGGFANGGGFRKGGFANGGGGGFRNAAGGGFRNGAFRNF